jgi:crotonobetainyl-CoA:carnitine CoA-transferase CaiB-like acyl-CoA transferase
MASTNAVTPPPEPSGPAHAGAFVIGGALLVAAGALAALAVFRSRRTDRGSLISRSMRKD